MTCPRCASPVRSTESAVTVRGGPSRLLLIEQCSKCSYRTCNGVEIPRVMVARRGELVVLQVQEPGDELADTYAIDPGLAMMLASDLLSVIVPT